MRNRFFYKKIHFASIVAVAIFSLSSLLATKAYSSDVTALTPDTFKSTVSPTSGVVVVDFSLNGCEACKNLEASGLLDKLASSYSDGKVRVAEITAASFSDADIKAISTNLGVTGVQSFPTIKIFVNGIDKGQLSNDTSNKNLITAWQTALGTYTGAGTGTSGATPVSSVNSPDANHECRLVLVTIKDTDKKNITNCNNIDFTTYLDAALDQLIPYIMIVALIMIVYSGFQYMVSGITGDIKAAKTRIVGILGGVVFFFLIRLVLNQITPNLQLVTTAIPTKPILISCLLIDQSGVTSVTKILDQDCADREGTQYCDGEDKLLNQQFTTSDNWLGASVAYAADFYGIPTNNYSNQSRYERPQLSKALQHLIDQSGVAKGKYVVGHYECGDFAYNLQKYLSAHITQPGLYATYVYVDCANGTKVGNLFHSQHNDSYHAINAIIDDNNVTVTFIEPQRGTAIIVEAGSKAQGKTNSIDFGFDNFFPAGPGLSWMGSYCTVMPFSDYAAATASGAASATDYHNRTRYAK